MLRPSHRYMARDGLTIVIFGDEHHSEVRGLAGLGRGRGIAALATSAFAVRHPRAGVPEASASSPKPLSEDEFASFVQRCARRCWQAVARYAS